MSRRLEPETIGLGTFAALPGAAIGFCGTFSYLLVWIIWQLDVDSATAGVAAALLPRPADWVTSAMYFTAYGLPSSAVLGAILGLVVGWVLGRIRTSSSPALGWIVGTFGAFLMAILVHVLLVEAGLRVAFAQSVRLFTVPTMIFIVGGGVLGVWLQQARRRLADDLDVLVEDDDPEDDPELDVPELEAPQQASGSGVPIEDQGADLARK